MQYCPAKVLLLFLFLIDPIQMVPPPASFYIQKEFLQTGRMFVTLLGYPSKCERKGVPYSCTLPLACWLMGGTSQGGCGTSSWIVACCVLSTKKNQKFKKTTKTSLHKMKRPNQLDKRMDDEFGQDCGVPLENIRSVSKRIIGGKQAYFGQFPWQAYIKIGSFQCGGVLVSRRFVLTAGHCVHNAHLKDIVVVLGELDTQNTGSVREVVPSEKYTVEKKVLHPLFQFRVTQPDRYDIALLELDRDASQVPYVVPICLPPPLKAGQLDGKFAVVAGWGKTNPHKLGVGAVGGPSTAGTNILRSVTVGILSTGQCRKWHEQKKIHVELYDEMLCAGWENGQKDACLGDSGGPLIVPMKGAGKEERWVLVGIISAGFGCGEPRQPGIYHNIGSSVNWIRIVLTQHLVTEKIPYNEIQT